MTEQRVIVAADLEGHILERLARAWIRHGTSRRAQELLCSGSTHPFLIRKRAEEAGMLFWVDPLPFVQHAAAARTAQCVMVHHMTEPEIAPFLAALPSADAVATSSVRWQRRLEELAGVRATLVPYVIDAQLFRPRNRDEARAALGIAPNAYVLGFSAKAKADAFGRKGIDLFVDTVKAAAQRWPDLTVLLIGSGWETLSRTLEESGARVVWQQPNRTEDTAPLYAAMDVFFCTSKEEGGPCTILEAMATEIPIVTTDVGHVPEVVDDGDNGFIARERTIDAFLGPVQQLRENAELRRRIAAAGRETILKRRDERVVSPSIPFDSMYDEAERRFRERSAAERTARSAKMMYLGARYAAARALARVRS